MYFNVNSFIWRGKGQISWVYFIPHFPDLESLSFHHWVITPSLESSPHSLPHPLVGATLRQPYQEAHPSTPKQWGAHLVRPRHQERSHLTKFSPSPIFSPLLFSIVSMNDRQNASITHSAHYSVRHHWHNAKQYQAEYRWRAEFRYGWTELLPLPTMELTSFSSFLLTWKYLEVEEPSLGPGHDEGNHDDEVTYQVVILLGKLKRKL